MKQASFYFRFVLMTGLSLYMGANFPRGSASFAAGDAEAPVAAPRPAPAAAIDDKSKSLTVAELAARAHDAVVVISFFGRTGNEDGLGTGFVVSPDGLIATNLHVIGEARPIRVRTADGKQHEVTEVHATDRNMDLALLRIDARTLPALELGDSDTLVQGDEVVALGNPLGLKYSVVSGVVSGNREIDGKPMIQLAIPIEPGNSGGPVIDRQGRVRGIVTMKSAVSQNLGFAVAINALKPLLTKPNPVPIARWLTIGALDEREWQPLFGARWRQRAGRILVDGVGPGFGGRSLGLWKHKTPDLPFEIGVWVKLKAEDGAAGLVFHADGGDKHYGFYPSGGKLRLSRFDGPDVFSWHVLSEVASTAYRPGMWNHLKVRLEKEKIRCYVNDEMVIESNDAVYSFGQAGLAKFRQTEAEFKGFRVANEIPATRPSRESIAQITGLVGDIASAPFPSQELVDKVAGSQQAGIVALNEQARRLEDQARQLRALAVAVRQKTVRNALATVLEKGEDEIDLMRAGLLLAALDNEELDVDAYLREFNRLGDELAQAVPPASNDDAKLAALNKFLFQERGFHGSRSDYYNRSNSYLNEVLDDREGLPITLAVVYMELAKRIGLKVVGVGLPGHFIVRCEPASRPSQLIDVYEQGAVLSREVAAARVASTTGQPLDESQLAAQSKRSILMRMLANLMNIAQESGDAEGMLRYVDAMLTVEPESAMHHWYRAVLYSQTGRVAQAIEETEWLFAREPKDVDLSLVRRLRRSLEEKP